MSRYGGDPRYSTGDLAYRDPPAARWDTDRFARERNYRAPPVIEQRPVYDDRRSQFQPAQPVYEDQRYYEEDRYGPRGNRAERRYFAEEEDFYDPRAVHGAMVPFRPERPARPEPPQPPARPGMIRRQSSLDTFDRRPLRRFDDYDDYSRAPHRPSVPVVPPSPRRPSRYQFDDRDYNDIRVQDPDYYGDEGFREYREREWVSRRRRSPSSSRSRERAPVYEQPRPPPPEEKPYPRRGKTKMPKRLVHTRVLYDLGYPYYELDEKTILIEKALGPENIDEIFAKSREYRERETITTQLIEPPPPPPPIVQEEKRVMEEIQTVPINEAPRSVREWDALSSRKPSRSRSRRRPSSPGVRETIIEKKIVEREISPARTARSSGTRRRSSIGSGAEVVERRIITRDDVDESNSVHVGPLALVVDRSKPRSDRDIKEQIRHLEAERQALRRERRYDRDSGEIVRVERVRERSPSPRAEIIVERRGEDIVEVRKDKRARSRPPAPSPGIIKAMMATLT